MPAEAHHTMTRLRVTTHTAIHRWPVVQKIRKVKEFLEDGDKVKISMLFRGREIAYTSIGLKIMESIREELESIATVEQQPRIEGRSMVMVVSPKK